MCKNEVIFFMQVGLQKICSPPRPEGTDYCLVWSGSRPSRSRVHSARSASLADQTGAARDIREEAS
jgi:hypothetical protein